MEGETTMEGDAMKKGYEAPAIRELGSLQELTQQSYNKIGTSQDIYSQNTPLVGSLVPPP